MTWHKDTDGVMSAIMHDHDTQWPEHADRLTLHSYYEWDGTWYVYGAIYWPEYHSTNREWPIDAFGIDITAQPAVIDRSGGRTTYILDPWLEVFPDGTWRPTLPWPEYADWPHGTKEELDRIP